MTKRTFTHVQVHPPDIEQGAHDDTCWSCTWSVIGDLRAPGTGYDDDANNEARDDLADTFPHVEFDPETACFYAYCKTEAEADALADRIDIWVNNRRGNSTPQPGHTDTSGFRFTSFGVGVDGPDPLIEQMHQDGVRSVNLGVIVGREPDYGIERVLSFTPTEGGLTVREECDEFFGFTLTADELKALIVWLLTRYAHLTTDGS